ncbi:MAG: 2Fe-2S iron-sulfur cluster-binding protein [Candidatus Nitrotoga sp.]|nr:2Fe-2S iron-sulfur cluster-binding protein [Candidatus Nitrotoga sp.]MDO9448601.1 2Fe-2S iron-sulfur cluster-binding protein [Candidatus Nitrotoga sp.]MDP3497446.1 2Fe-2S iron-sulfur cluster-binding protein [Candidatus Nitrotoga sp.]
MSADTKQNPITQNTITIDGQEIPFLAGQTIMDAALAAGVYIPHLCHRQGLTPHGSCKLCVVDIASRSASACTMPAVAGQQISNNTPALNEVRKTITQMLFIEGNHICPSCEKCGDCTLQAMAYHLGMLDGHFPQFFQRREVDASHPTIMLDRDRCILCELCVRASREVDGKNVFAIAGRGINSHLIVNSVSGKLVDSDLKTSDMAAHICPVGAILIKEHGYEVPIGQRTFDLHQVSEIGLEKTILTKVRQPDE